MKQIVELHGFEALIDIESKILEAIIDLGIPAEFRGTVHIELEYVPEEEDDEEVIQKQY